MLDNGVSGLYVFNESRKINDEINVLNETKKRIPFGLLFFKRTNRANSKYFCKVDCNNEFKYQACKRYEFEQYGLTENDLPNEIEYNKFQVSKNKLFWYKSKLVHFYFDNLKSINYQVCAAIKYPLYEKRKKLYEWYMKSNDWSMKRNECMEIHSGYCVDCFENNGIYENAQCVHHLHYDSLGNEDVKKDIIPLCGDCHKKRHNIPVDDIHPMFDAFEVQTNA